MFNDHLHSGMTHTWMIFSNFKYTPYMQNVIFQLLLHKLKYSMCAVKMMFEKVVAVNLLLEKGRLVIINFVLLYSIQYFYLVKSWLLFLAN